MEDQRDLISNHEQLPMLGQRSGAPESKCSRGALYTGFSVLVALLLAGQATTAYFLYQQQGRLDKLTVTSQNLQLESLRMKLPKPAKPLSKMRMATPMLMQALPMEGLPQGVRKPQSPEGGQVPKDRVTADPGKAQLRSGPDSWGTRGPTSGSGIQGWCRKEPLRAIPGRRARPSSFQGASHVP